MIELDDNVVYVEELNKILYSNNYVINSGMTLKDIQKSLGTLSEYISEDQRDILYAKSKGVRVYEETNLPMQYSLIEDINLEMEINDILSKDIGQISEVAFLEELEYILNEEHNILLLKMAFILKKFLIKHNINVFMMRGSAISSYVLYVIGLNKVNPLKFNLDYKNFWKS